MGVERVATLLQGVENVYETDLVRPVIGRAEELSGRRYGADPTDDVRFRVIADHARSGVMIIGDGVTPGNEGRGYVLRRLLRRIVRSARLLGVTEPVLQSFAEVVRDEMSPSYPELTTDFERISAVVRAEEEAFLATLTAGSRIFDTAVTDTKQAGRHAAGRRQGLPAARHLRLPDRPHPGDGVRGRAHRRRAGLPHGSWTSSAPGRRPTRRPARPGTATWAPTGRCSTTPATPSSSATRTWSASRGSSGSSSTGSGCRPPGRAPPSRSCWTAPRSTPRAAASRPTPA